MAGIKKLRNAVVYSDSTYLMAQVISVLRKTVELACDATDDEVRIHELKGLDGELVRLKHDVELLEEQRVSVQGRLIRLCDRINLLTK